ncbi:hypothetical protein SK128_001509, partial [Halocaridina rubra]
MGFQHHIGAGLPEMLSWKIRIDQYFESVGVTDDEKKKTPIGLNGGALQKQYKDYIADCSSVEDENKAWARFHEKDSTSAIIRDVLLGLKSLKPMKPATAREMKSVLDELTAFARRIRELNEEQEL